MKHLRRGVKAVLVFLFLFGTTNHIDSHYDVVKTLPELQSAGMVYVICVYMFCMGCPWLAALAIGRLYYEQGTKTALFHWTLGTLSSIMGFGLNFIVIAITSNLVS